MKRFAKFLLSSILLYSSLSAFSQNQKDKLLFHSKTVGEIHVERDSIFVNNKALYGFEEFALKYSSKLNRLIEDRSSVFLFLVIDGSPNRDRLYGFKITSAKADSIVDAIASEIKDFDKDGYLEFGGSDLTEVHPSKDSMYYIPSAFYEIRNGNIIFDSLLTKKKDIEVNGIYLKDQLDTDGNCCRVIAKPTKKKPK